jgi:hypothetical protein
MILYFEAGGGAMMEAKWASSQSEDLQRMRGASFTNRIGCTPQPEPEPEPEPEMVHSQVGTAWPLLARLLLT